MIVGEGFLARAFSPRFRDDKDTLVFASGVSNSRETSEDDFARERSLLQSMLGKRARRFVYFGSCGVSTSEADQTAYMRHKKSMEAMLLSSPGTVILRLPQVVGFARNTHTLTNFLRDRIQTGEHFSIWANAERNLIDIDDVVSIGSQLIIEADREPKIFSIAAKKSARMPEIVGIFERVLGRSANYSLEDKGEQLRIDAGAAIQAADSLGIDLGEGYLERVIAKYYDPSAKPHLLTKS